MKRTTGSGGLFLALAVLVLRAPAAWAVCGDGILDPGEQCDVGADPTGTCCTASCTLVSAGTECRQAAGDCDVAEVCTGAAALPAEPVQASAGVPPYGWPLRPAGDVQRHRAHVS
jgi:hypothetical protein